MPRNRLSPEQINLRSLFSVSRVLSARGLTASISQDLEQTFLGQQLDWEDQRYISFYEWFSISKNRHDLLVLIERKIRNSKQTLHGRSPYSIEAIKMRFRELVECEFDVTEEACRSRFSATVEWLLGEILIREFQAHSSSFGVKISNLSDANETHGIGDYDVVSVLSDMSLAYVECKSGGTNFDQIAKAIRRSRLLGSAATLIALPGKTGNFETLCKVLSLKVHPLHDVATTVYRVSAFGLASSEIFGWGSTIFIPLTSDSLKNSIRTALRLADKIRHNTITYEANFTGTFGSEIQNLFNADGFRLCW